MASDDEFFDRIFVKIGQSIDAMRPQAVWMGLGSIAPPASSSAWRHRGHRRAGCARRRTQGAGRARNVLSAPRSPQLIRSVGHMRPPPRASGRGLHRGVSIPRRQGASAATASLSSAATCCTRWGCLRACGSRSRWSLCSPRWARHSRREGRTPRRPPRLVPWPGARPADATRGGPWLGQATGRWVS